MQERNGEVSVLEPARLGRGGKLLVVFACFSVVALVVAFLWIHQARRDDEQKRKFTNLTLQMFWLDELTEPSGFIVTPPPRPKTREEVLAQEKESVLAHFADKRDGWGNPFIFRCPGPVHTKGWDLYSTGPNGKDDFGLGDDILVGEDIAAVESGG